MKKLVQELTGNPIPFLVGGAIGYFLSKKIAPGKILVTSAIIGTSAYGAHVLYKKLTNKGTINVSGTSVKIEPIK